MLGWAGVQLFFTISGFLITRILLAARDDTHPFRSFYIRRALRIFPIYYLFLLALIWVHVDAGATERLQSLPYYVLYIQNVPSVMLDTGLVAADHTWSLAIEEQFYWLWPAVVLLLSPSRVRYLVAGFFFAAPLWRLLVVGTGASPYLATGTLPSQMDSIVVGSAIALAVHAGLSPSKLRRAGWVGLGAGGAGVLILGAIIGFLSFWFIDEWATATGGFLFPTALALLFGGTTALIVSGLTPRVLERRELVWTGKVSYGIYLYHGLVFFLLDDRFGSLEDTAAGELVLMTSKLLLTFVVAGLSWRFVERPLLALKDRWAPPMPRSERRAFQASDS